MPCSLGCCCRCCLGCWLFCYPGSMLAFLYIYIYISRVHENGICLANLPTCTVIYSPACHQRDRPSCRGGALAKLPGTQLALCDGTRRLWHSEVAGSKLFLSLSLVFCFSLLSVFCSYSFCSSSSSSFFFFVFLCVRTHRSAPALCAMQWLHGS